ncbi:MAG TPA: HEAT repeat domain-containing protein, partial [Pirellulales bacterium]|nr:HEAT repeat domain-containing protein [Pirellulales bacterium]
KCLSYLTIELRAPIPQELRSGLGDWLFGCDICQDVCPWNRKAPESAEPAFSPLDRRNPLELAEMFSWSEEEFRRRFRGSPLLRAKRRGLLRNAAIVLGNQGDPAAVGPLSIGLADAERLVRGAAAWALGRLATPAAREALAARQTEETDAEVREEIEAALAGAADSAGN